MLRMYENYKIKKTRFFHCGFADDREATWNDCMAFGCNKEQCTKVARLLTGAYEREGKRENMWKGDKVTGTQGYPEPRRWDAERHWKRTDNKKKLIMTEHEFKLPNNKFHS